MLALDPVDALHGRAHLDELVLGLLPLALVDQLLHLLKLRRGEGDLVVAHLFLLAEDGGPHPVERITGTRAVHRGAEPTDAQHRRSYGPDDGQPAAGAAVSGLTAAQRVDGVAQRDRSGDGRVPHVIAELGEEEGQLGLLGAGRVDRLLGGERFEVAVRSIDLVE